MINAKDIVCSSKLVEEPLIEINKNIDLITNNIVLVTGGRGVGKTTLLLNREISNKLKGITSIYTKFKQENVDGYIKEDDMEHYYELEMTQRLLNHIKREGKESKISLLIDRERSYYIKELTSYVNDPMNKNTITKRGLLKKGDFTEELVHEIRKNEGCNSLELLIERFDNTEEVSPYAQNYIKNYFDYFDKNILVVNDPNYNKVYDAVELNYTKDIYIVNTILTRYISESNLNNKLGWFDFFSNQTVGELIKISHGDLKMILEAFEYVTEYSTVTELNYKALMSAFKTRIEELKEGQIKIKSYSVQPKLYI